MWPTIIGAALGLLKGQQDKDQWKKQMNVEASREQGSAFTGNHGRQMASPSMMGSIMQGGLTGMMMDQQMAQSPKDIAIANEAKPGFVGPQRPEQNWWNPFQ